MRLIGIRQAAAVFAHGATMRRTIGLLVCLLAGGLLADDGKTVEGWAKSRVREQLLAEPARPQGQLWRERPPNEALSGFVAPTSLAPLIRAVRDAVVNISTSNVRQSTTVGRSLGSGFIISPQGHVVTNNHVVEKARVIRVKLADGREFVADVVGRDPSTDVALLKLEGEGLGNLPTAFLGDSDKLEVGDWVVAIGNPFGLDHSVSHGMISAKERVIGVGVFDDFIQTDALINPGNSGGPLFNMRGEVVGVNTAIVSQGQGIGFAVPINMVKDLLPNLLINGHLARGWLGVNIHESASANGKGAVVTDVFKNSPAAAAGLKPGDRLTAVNGKPIESYLQLLRRIAILAPGTEAKLTVVRDGSSREVSVRLSERPSPERLQLAASAGRVEELGLLLRDLTQDVARNLSLSPFSGVLVAGVLPHSPAEQAGLQAGDVVLEVNRKRVQDVKSFKAVLEQTGSGQPTLVKYQRGDTVRYVALK